MQVVLYQQILTQAPCSNLFGLVFASDRPGYPVPNVSKLWPSESLPKPGLYLIAILHIAELGVLAAELQHVVLLCISTGSL